MNTFVNAVQNQEARTENNMKAFANTSNAVLDLFYNIGAMRGKNIIPLFTAAYVENPELAIRVALYARDIRGGAGERKIFRDILNYVAEKNIDHAMAMVVRIPELGRWDDMLDIKNIEVRNLAFSMIAHAIKESDALVAKWMPRKGEIAIALRNFLGMSPKQYRKTLVNLTQVVETQMCNKDWDNINFNHVPSLASTRYKKAFARHTPKYAEWTKALVSTDPTIKVQVKVNAGAVYPYDVLKGIIPSSIYHISHTYSNMYNTDNKNHIIAQWQALPNYVGDKNILPLVDVSGSMTSKVGGNFTCMDVAVSLGLYLSDKNTGSFKDTFLTFSGNPELLHLKGNVIDKIYQMIQSNWGMNTNLHNAIQKILDVATKGNVPNYEMPEMLLILSDMQFDNCVQYDDSALQMIDRKYEQAGYSMPKIVFWNLNGKYNNTPSKSYDKNVALVSGFSPFIVETILSGNVEEFTPFNIMMKKIMDDRYNF